MTKKELKEFNPKEDIGKVVEQVWCKNFINYDISFLSYDKVGRLTFDEMSTIKLYDIPDGAPKGATHYVVAEKIIEIDRPTGEVFLGEMKYYGQDKILGVTYLKLRDPKEK